MNRTEAIFILNQFEEECRKNHLDSEAEAHAMGIYALGTIEELRKERDAAMAQQTCGDTISRQAAIDAIRNIKAIKGTSDDKILLIDKAEAQAELMKLPSAEPERKTGRWYKPQGYPRDSYRFICDNCHDVAYYVTGNNGRKIKSDSPKCGYHYCPNCGAKMEVEHE